MRRRLDLAASLVSRPRVLFLDEPTTGLDPPAAMTCGTSSGTSTADGVTVLLTTQYLEEADQLASEIAVVDHGAVIATGTPEQLKSRTGAHTLVLRPADPADLAVTVSIVTALIAGRAWPDVRAGTELDRERPRCATPR